IYPLGFASLKVEINKAQASRLAPFVLPGRFSRHFSPAGTFLQTLFSSRDVSPDTFLQTNGQRQARYARTHSSARGEFCPEDYPGAGEGARSPGRTGGNSVYA